MWVQDKIWPSNRDFRWGLSLRGLKIDAEGVELDFVSWSRFFALWFQIIRSGRMKKNIKTETYGISQRALSGWVARQNTGWKGRHLGVLGPIYHRFCMMSCLKQRSQVIWVCPKILQFMIIDAGANSVDEGSGHKLSRERPKIDKKEDETSRSEKNKAKNEKPSTSKRAVKSTTTQKKKISKKVHGSASKASKKPTSKKKRVPIMDKAPSSGGRKKKVTRKKAPS